MGGSVGSGAGSAVGSGVVSAVGSGAGASVGTGSGVGSAAESGGVSVVSGAGSAVGSGTSVSTTTSSASGGSGSAGAATAGSSVRAGRSSAANTVLAVLAAIQQARSTANRRFLICCSSSHSLPWGLSPTGIALEYTAPAPQNASRCVDVQKVIFSSKKKKHLPKLAGALVNYAVFTPGRTYWARRAGRSCGQRCCMRSGRR